MADDMDVDKVPKTKERKEKDSGKARFEVKKVSTLELLNARNSSYLLNV
jgi:hypothetical protein